MAVERVIYLFTALFCATSVTAELLPPRIGDIAQSTTASLAADLTDLYTPHTISIPVDHFPNEARYEPHSDEMFDLRYWFDDSNYEEGGPVIVLHSGETSGEGRLPFLQKGIVAILAQATKGIGVVMEHRYYGESFPTEDLSTESLRFLSTEQALADSAYFAQNVVFEGLEDKNLTAPGTPYILYGGSYAGGQVAFLRTEYPEIFWGAIASSGVVKAIYDFWEYFEPVRKTAPKDCVEGTQTFVDMIDEILINQEDDKELVDLVKGFFALGNLTYADDFVNQLANGIYGWQSRNWDPAVNNPSFSQYCGNITSEELLYPASDERKKNAEAIIKAGGYEGEGEALVTSLTNYAGWVNVTTAAPCIAQGKTLDECFTNHDSEYYKQDDISQTWRCWWYQICTEWGYLQTGSGVPDDIKPLISRLLDIEYTSITCREAFDIHEPTDVDRVNKYGGYDIEHDRLAFIDGTDDPWLEATTHSTHARDRESTDNKPFILIPDAGHHWDENGLLPNETTPELPPERIKEVQAEEARFVKKWLEDFANQSS